MHSEILNQVENNKYHKLLIEKIDLLENCFRFPVKIILIKNNYGIKQDGIKNGGKVVWQVPRDQSFKIANELKIDAQNLKNIEFLAIFLHECGHIQDSENLEIIFNSKESEISAWKHAYKSFNKQNPSNEDSKLFLKKMEQSLTTYEIAIESVIEK